MIMPHVKWIVTLFMFVVFVEDADRHVGVDNDDDDDGDIDDGAMMARMMMMTAMMICWR